MIEPTLWFFSHCSVRKVFGAMAKRTRATAIFLQHWPLGNSLFCIFVEKISRLINNDNYCLLQPWR